MKKPLSFKAGAFEFYKMEHNTIRVTDNRNGETQFLREEDYTALADFLRTRWIERRSGYERRFGYGRRAGPQVERRKPINMNLVGRRGPKDRRGNVR